MNISVSKAKLFLLIISDLDHKCNILVKIDLSYLFCRAFSAKNKAEPIHSACVYNRSPLLLSGLKEKPLKEYSFPQLYADSIEEIFAESFANVNGRKIVAEN